MFSLYVINYCDLRVILEEPKYFLTAFNCCVASSSKKKKKKKRERQKKSHLAVIVFYIRLYSPQVCVYVNVLEMKIFGYVLSQTMQIYLSSSHFI